MDRGKRRFLKTMTSNVVIDRQKRFENATCGRGFFRKREKKSSVSKISGYVWTGPDNQSTMPLVTLFPMSVSVTTVLQSSATVSSPRQTSNTYSACLNSYLFIFLKLLIIQVSTDTVFKTTSIEIQTVLFLHAIIKNMPCFSQLFVVFCCIVACF